MVVNIINKDEFHECTTGEQCNHNGFDSRTVLHAEVPVELTFSSKAAIPIPLDAPEPARPMKCPLPILLAKREAPIWTPMNKLDKTHAKFHYSKYKYVFYFCNVRSLNKILSWIWGAELATMTNSRNIEWYRYKQGKQSQRCNLSQQPDWRNIKSPITDQRIRLTRSSSQKLIR